METELCYVYGPHASGKGVLCRLLDGHSNLGVTIHHDAFPKLIDGHFDINTVEKENLFRKLRASLVKTRYYQLEDFAKHKDPHFEISAEDRVEESIELDFYQMERDWTSKTTTEMSDSDLIKSLFHSLLTNLAGHPYNNESCQYYIGMGDKDPSPMENLIEKNDNNKVIFVKRDPRAVVVSKGSRTTKKPIKYYIKDGRVFEAKKLIKIASDLERRYPEQVLVVSFRDLILNSRQIMNEISGFLNIEKEDILYSPSFCGRTLTPKSDYVGEIKDEWKGLVSKDERYALDLQSGRIPTGMNLSAAGLYIQSIVRRAAQTTYKDGKMYAKKLFRD